MISCQNRNFHFLIQIQLSVKLIGQLGLDAYLANVFI